MANKKLGEEHRADRTEHAQSLANMAARDFPLVNVYKETIAGVYAEDRTSFLPSSWIKEKVTPDPLATSLGIAKRDFPNRPGTSGVLLHGLAEDVGSGAGSSSGGGGMDIDVKGPVEHVQGTADVRCVSAEASAPSAE